MHTLYIVSTPIGNLEDVTLRALRILREVALVAAEDTRVTRKLLSHYDIHVPLVSFNENNQSRRLPQVLEALKSGDVALVCDAGTPGVNDPGNELVNAAVDAGATIVPIPGPSAVTAALAVSGLQDGAFVYLGFLPRKKAERRRLLESYAQEEKTLVAFEAPHRIIAALQDIKLALGDRNIAVCRELTKMHEEIFRGRVSESIEHFTEPRGEFTLVIEGAAASEGERVPDDTAILDLMKEHRSRGYRAREAVAAVAAVTGISRRKAYDMWLQSDEKAADNTVARRPENRN